MHDIATARLQLPFLEAGQAQKELTHNEALLRLDQLVHGAVIEVGRNDPPVAPAPGDAWIVGPMPIGMWVGQSDAIASWTIGGWRFAPPCEGMRVWSRSGVVDATFHDGAWHVGEVRARQVVVDGKRVLGAQQGPIAPPSGGGTIDIEGRTAIAAVLEALRRHGLIAA